MDMELKTKQEYIELLRKMAQIQSLTGSEKEMAVFLKGELEKIGINGKIDGAGNVWGEIACGEGPTILLNGHLDTVPAGDLNDWKPYTPFEGILEGDVMIGRGVSDLKAGLAAQFFAFKQIKEALDSGAKMKGTVIFSAVVHEEAAEMLGMKYLIEHTLADRKIDLCVLCEPTSGKIALGQRGKIELVIKTYGKAAHSSQPKQGINALEKMIPVMEAIFNKLPSKLNLKTELGNNTVTITDCIVKPGVQSIIPYECEISVDRRYLPEETLDEIVLQIQNILDNLAKTDATFKAEVYPRVYQEETYTGYKCTIEKHHPAWKVNEENPIVKTAIKAIQKVEETDGFYWQFGTDGGYTASVKEIPTIGYSHAEEKWAHQPKEQVSISQMMKTVEGTRMLLSDIVQLKSECIYKK